MRPHTTIPAVCALAMLTTFGPSDWAIGAPQSEYLPNPLEIRVYGQSTWLSGSQVAARVLVSNHVTEDLIRGAAVRFLLQDPEGEAKEVDLGLYHTDANGTVRAELRVPQIEPASRQLMVRVSARDLGINTVTRPLRIVRKEQILLTTDKPLYQPGQTIHIRALSLRRPDRKAVAGEDITLEVADSKGNKVFKRPQKTSEFGVASAEFTLADEVNLGAYEIRAIMGDTEQSKTVTIDRYVLPKFRLTPVLDKAYYLPGDTVTGSVAAEYFFGEPVEKGEATIVVSTFDVEFREIARLTGATDNEGVFEFETKLPEHFVGQPLEGGQAFLQFEVSVVDGADHEEKTTVTRSVAADPIEVVAIPESGDLVPGVENIVYVVTSYPDGSPAQARVTLAPQGATPAQEHTTSEAGVARVPVMPALGAQYVVTARDDLGQETQRTVQLESQFAQAPVLLRPDKALYNVGDTLTATILAPAAQVVAGMGGPVNVPPSVAQAQTKMPVFFDIVRDGQTVLTDVARPEDGHAEVSVDLTPAHAGTLQLHAYRILADGQIIRDSRVVYVHEAGDLTVKVEPSADTFLPGDNAQLVLSVSDSRGKPVSAALGVEVVDESVFALSDNQPGLERVYFTLQRELLTPRYEIHAFQPDDVIKAYTDPVAAPEIEARQEDAAAALFAAATDSEPFTLTANSWEDGMAEVWGRWTERMRADATQILRALVTHKQRHGGDQPPKVSVLVDSGILAREHTMDPLGNPYEVEINDWNSLSLRSAGIDGKLNTDDDMGSWYWGETEDDQIVARDGWEGEMLDRAIRFRRGGPMPARGMMPGEMMEGMGGAGMGGGMGGMVAAEADMAMPLAASELKSDMDSGAGAPVRIREWFPETLFVDPAVITDANGRAELSIPMADSITTWRLTALANSAAGALGSTTAPIKVFQDFFIDIDLPVELTQGDQVSIPIAVYNYLPGSQTVTLRMEKGDWFDLEGDYERSLSIESREVSVVYFPITVQAFGSHTLTVHASGSKMSDAIKRTIRVVPNGKRLEESISDRLEGTVRKTVVIPEGAIEGASTILVKVYPGVLSQVVEGLDAILQMPFGCFEQTSSTTYPNILVLDYMRTTGQGSPEIEMKATEYISVGYQRLLSFEVAGGGFEWFGNAPANKVLTAYGVLEFSDMSKVYDVDPAVLERTQQWLLSLQEGDGSWSPDASYLHDESWGRIQNNKLLPTAYIGWSIAESGNTSSGVDKAMAYVRDHLQESSDPYTLGICANALVAADPKGQATKDLLRRLVDMRKSEGGKSWWATEVATICHGSGNAADIEASALIGYALIRAGQFPEVAGQVIDWLVSQKDSRGTWHSTQATVLALKTLLASMGSATREVNGEATVVINGQAAAAFAITPENSDVLQQVDLRQYVKGGANDLEIRFGGEGSTLYQIASLYYMPWESVRPIEELLSIDVSYDREELTTDDVVTATVKVTNTRPGIAKMVVVDLGIPPGFTPVPGDLAEWVGQVFTKYTQTSQQVIIYFDEIDGSKGPAIFSYRLKAKYPLRAKTPRSRVYEYYNPDVEGFAEPAELVVSQ